MEKKIAMIAANIYAKECSKYGVAHLYVLLLMSSKNKIYIQKDNLISDEIPMIDDYGLGEMLLTYKILLVCVERTTLLFLWVIP